MMKIAIDGPSGAGKSTVAKMLAARLDILYLDTGAMYRCVGLSMLRRGIDPLNESDVVAAASGLRVDVRYESGKQVMLLDGEDVTEAIREHAVSSAASAVSAYGDVRRKLVAMQRKIAAKQPAVLDGRDIGTHVLPDADYKFYLTASVEVRAQRRYEELKAKGRVVDLDTIRSDIEQRDYDDSHREISPLRQAQDAIVIDSSALDISAVLNKILSFIR